MRRFDPILTNTYKIQRIKLIPENEEIELVEELISALIDKVIRESILKNLKENKKFLNLREFKGSEKIIQNLREFKTDNEYKEFKKYFIKQTYSIRKHYEDVFRKYECDVYNYRYDKIFLKSIKSIEKINHRLNGEKLLEIYKKFENKEKTKILKLKKLNKL